MSSIVILNYCRLVNSLDRDLYNQIDFLNNAHSDIHSDSSIVQQ